jgi:hypothetical protein
MDAYAHAERMAIAIIDGGMSEEEARAIADAQCGIRRVTREEAMREWLRVAGDKYGAKAAKAAKALLKRHGVDSMDDLSADDLLASIERMRG